MRHNSYIVLLLIFLVSCTKEIENPLLVESLSPMPEARTSAAAFSINGKGYVFGGRSAKANATATLFCYDAETDTWSTINGVPLKARVHAAAATLGEHVYIGLGYNGSFYEQDSHLKDWWRYTPSTNTWAQMADFPTYDTNAAVCMVHGEDIYVCYGNNNLDHTTRTVYRYTPGTNTWTELEDTNGLFPSPAMACVGCTCQRRMFVGGGHRGESLRHWNELFVDNVSSTYEKRSTMPGSGRCLAAAGATENYIYIFGGRKFGGTVTDGIVYQDILQYDVANDKWTIAGMIPDCERENLVAITINGTVFFGIGNDKQNNIQNTWYKLHE